MLPGLKLRFECELVETRGVVRIEVADLSEVSTAKFCTAVPQREDEAWRVANVVGLGTELQVHALGQRKVLEERQIHVTEVGAEERIARRIADFPRRLRCEGGDVEELGLRLVSTRVEQRVRPIPATAVIRYRAIRVGLGDRLPGGRIDVGRGVVIARPGIASIVENREGLTALPDGDGIDLPTCERLFRYTCPVLAILKLVIQRKRKAVLDIVFRNAILNLPQPRRVSIAEALLAAFLRVARNVAKSLRPGVVRIEGQTLGQAPLDSDLETVVVGNPFTLHQAYPAEVASRELRIQFARSAIGTNGCTWLIERAIGVGAVRGGLVDVVDHLRQVVPDVADVV